MAASMTANKTLEFDDLDLPGRQAAALMASGQDQEQALKSIRANAIREAKKERGRQAAAWVQRSFSALDRAFWQGFYSPQRQTANAQTANDQRLDWEEWEDRAEENLQEIRYNLTIVDAFIGAGFATDSSLARTVYTRQKESAWQIAGEVSMDGRARSDDDEAVLTIIGTPLPIVHVDYNISARNQQQSMNFGEDIETRSARQAGRILRETEEDLMIDGWGPTVTDSEGNTLTMYGLTDSSVNLSGTVAGGWGTPGNILDTIDNFLNTMESQTTDNNRGPDPEEQGAWLFYHPNQRSDLRAEDPRGDGNMSVRQRIEQDYPYLELRSAGALDDGDVIMVAKDERFVEVINAQAPTNLSEEVDFGLATKFKTLSCRIPFFKTTYDGIAGIVNGTGA